jgi:hypothetical protein
LTTVDTTLEFPRSMDLLGDPDIWIADSDCSAHCTGHKHGMIDVQKYENNSGDGYVQPDGSKRLSVSTGDLPVMCHDKHGRELGSCRMTGVNCVHGQRFNLFSTTKLQLDGWIPGGNKEALWLSHPDSDFVVKFDIKIETGRGCVFAACFRRRIDEHSEFGFSNIRMNILQAHRRLGHSNEDTTRKIDRSLGWDITRGSLDTCEACAVAKAQQKNVAKVSKTLCAAHSNDRVFVDLAYIKPKENMPIPTLPHWLIIVDEYTQLKRVEFFRTKSDIVEHLCE